MAKLTLAQIAKMEIEAELNGSKKKTAELDKQSSVNLLKALLSKGQIKSSAKEESDEE